MWFWAQVRRYNAESVTRIVAHLPDFVNCNRLEAYFCHYTCVVRCYYCGVVWRYAFAVLLAHFSLTVDFRCEELIFVNITEF